MTRLSSSVDLKYENPEDHMEFPQTTKVCYSSHDQNHVGQSQSQGPPLSKSESAQGNSPISPEATFTARPVPENLGICP